jgi:hypothetical protein
VTLPSCVVTIGIFAILAGIVDRLLLPFRGHHRTEAPTYDSPARRLVLSFIERQKAAVLRAFFSGTPLRWETTDSRSENPDARSVTLFGCDSSGERRVHLLFSRDTGRLRCLSLIRQENCPEPPMTADGAERTAGFWLNRLGPTFGTAWRPTGQREINAGAAFSHWRAGSSRAFVGIARRSGQPILIWFKDRG